MRSPVCNRRPRCFRPSLAFICLLAFLAPAPADARPRRIDPAPQFFANLTVTVTDRATGQPVPGGRVSLSALGFSATTDGSGQLLGRALPLGSSPSLTTTIVITATGYGEWTIQNVRLLAADTLLLTADLALSPTRIVEPDLAGGSGFESRAHVPLATTDQSNLPPPLTIRVRVTGNGNCNLSLPYTVQTIDFREYVKHVLPNEWGASWNAESLKAGAMAARMYAWYQVARGGKWFDADVYDSTCDQVYRPNIAYASTNAAVDAIWAWRLMKDNLLVATYYRAYYSQCEGAGLAGRCMGQWDSKWLADAGSTWDQILTTFYTGATLSLAPPNIGLAPPPLWLREKVFLALVVR